MGCLDLNPNSAIHLLCDLGHLAHIFVLFPSL